MFILQTQQLANCDNLWDYFAGHVGVVDLTMKNV